MKGGLQERGPNKWLIKWSTGKDPLTGKYGQRHEVFTGSRAEARIRRNDLIKAQKQGTAIDPRRLTVGQWLDQWLTTYAAPNVSEKTREGYDQRLRSHVVPYLGTIAIQKLTPLQIDRLYEQLRKGGRRSQRKPKDGVAMPAPTGISERTLHHLHTVLGQAFSEAVRKRIVDRNPMDAVTPPRPGAKRTAGEDNEGNGETVKALSREQLESLLKGLRGTPTFSLAVLLAGTGARLGEALAVRWCDLSHEKGTLRIERSVENTKKPRIKLPKNKSSKRTIAIDGGLVGLLRNLRKQQMEDALKLGRRLPADGLIFPKSILEPTGPQLVRDASKTLAKAFGKAGFPGYTAHCLRHTHASLLLSDGVPIVAVSQRLGHANPTITLNTYSHLVKRAEEQAAAVAGSLLAGALSPD